jgi:hypothetical protein
MERLHQNQLCVTVVKSPHNLANPFVLIPCGLERGISAVDLRQVAVNNRDDKVAGGHNVEHAQATKKNTNDGDGHPCRSQKAMLLHLVVAFMPNS